jgi:hypothetical protein
MIMLFIKTQILMHKSNKCSKRIKIIKNPAQKKVESIPVELKEGGEAKRLGLGKNKWS